MQKHIKVVQVLLSQYPSSGESGSESGPVRACKAWAAPGPVGDPSLASSWTRPCNALHGTRPVAPGLAAGAPRPRRSEAPGTVTSTTRVTA